MSDEEMKAELDRFRSENRRPKKGGVFRWCPHETERKITLRGAKVSFLRRPEYRKLRIKTRPRDWRPCSSSKGSS